MAYTITTTQGTTLASIQDGTVNSTATSLTLIGKNYAGYGIFLNENYIKLLENFTNSTAPSSPLMGQLWYDSSQSLLKVYDGTQWKPISSSSAGGISPTNPITGDLWYDSTNAQLKVWSGSTWITVGPNYSTSSGTSGAVVETVLDSLSVSHVVVKFYISNTVVAILSKDTTAWVPQPGIAGFATVKPGFNLVSSNTLTGSQFTGDASNALSLQGVLATSFLRSDIPTSTPFAFGAASLLVGGNLVMSTTGVGQTTIANQANNQNILFNINKGGVVTTEILINGSTGRVTIADDLLISGLAGINGANIRNATDSTSWTTGALVVAGGLGVAKNIYTNSGVWAANLNVTGLGITPAAKIVGNLNVTGQNSSFNDPVAVASASQVLAINNGTNAIYFNSKLISGTGNPIITGNDAGLLFTGPTNFAIAPVSTSVWSTGIRIVTATGQVVVPNTAPTTNTTSGALVVGGGVGIGGNVVAGSLAIPGAGHTFYGNVTISGTLNAGNITLSGTSTQASLGLTGNIIAGLAQFAAINSTIIGNATPAAGTFTSGSFNTVAAGAVNAVTIGNTGATVTGSTSNFGAVNAVTIGNVGAVHLGATGAFSGNVIGGLAQFAAINGTVIGNATPSSSVFTYVIAGNVQASIIGNTGTQFNGASVSATYGAFTSWVSTNDLTTTGQLNITQGNLGLGGTAVNYAPSVGQSVTSATLVDLTGLVVTTQANKVYKFDAFIPHNSSVAQTKGFAVKFTSGHTCNYTVEQNVTATGALAVSGGTANVTAVTGATAGAVSAMTCRITGTIGGPTAGHVQIQGQTSTGTLTIVGNSAITLTRIG